MEWFCRSNGSFIQHGLIVGTRVLIVGVGPCCTEVTAYYYVRVDHA